MKQILTFITLCISGFSTSIFGQGLYGVSAIIEGVAYQLQEYAIDYNECGTVFYEAMVIELPATTSEDNKYSGNLLIPENVEYDGVVYRVNYIGASCFVDCSELESVQTLGALSIEYNSFQNCQKLTKITIGNNINSLVSIKSYGISNCPNLKELILSDNLTKLDNNAIEASGLERLELPENIKSMGENSLCLPALKELICHVKEPIRIDAANPFGSGDKGINLKECVLRVPAGSVEAYKAADHWREFGQILPIEDAGIIAPEVEAQDCRSYDLLGRPASGKGLRIVSGKKTLVR